MIIAIDGPAATGKSTTAKLVAQKLGFLYLDTGALYRCVTLSVLDQKIAIDDLPRIDAALHNLSIEFKQDGDYLTIFMNSVDVTQDIRKANVTQHVSAVSALGIVREELVQIQRQMANETDCVVEGRDIGTVVFPEADFKFFITAATQVRAARRQKDSLALGEKRSIAELEEDIKRRDKYDSNRKLSPLRMSEDAVVIDTTNLTIDEQVSKIIEIIKS